MNKKLNGFNNGRDASDGVGGGPGPFERMKNHPGFKNTVWEALYCPCIHESAYGTISIHKTQKGALDAIEIHKAKAKIEFDEMFSSLSEEEQKSTSMKFGKHEAWMVKEREVLN